MKCQKAKTKVEDQYSRNNDYRDTFFHDHWVFRGLMGGGSLFLFCFSYFPIQAWLGRPPALAISGSLVSFLWLGYGIWQYRDDSRHRDYVHFEAWFNLFFGAAILIAALVGALFLA